MKCLLPEIRETWGCDFPETGKSKTRTTLYLADGSEDTFRHCPFREIAGDMKWIDFLLTNFDHYKNKHLPRAGGSLEQPRAMMEAFRFIDSESNRLYKIFQKLHKED